LLLTTERRVCDECARRATVCPDLQLAASFGRRAAGGRVYNSLVSTFKISGLDPAMFSHLFGKSDEELAALNVRRHIVDAKPGYPDRVEMRDLDVGEKALLVNFTHLDVNSPYRASHAIWVREGAAEAYEAVDEIPEVLSRRLLSVRAFDTDAMMVDADVIDGKDLRRWVASTFESSCVDFIDVHNAKPGCFAARVRRAQSEARGSGAPPPPGSPPVTLKRTGGEAFAP
jgi:hypothetical protein